jgi:pumilio homology domain family member 6
MIRSFLSRSQTYPIYPAIAYFKAFKGKAPELLRHPAGTHVLDDLYSQASGEQRRMMAAEFYGKEYSLFGSGTLNNTKGAPESLASLLSAVEGQKQLSIVKHVASALTPVMEKGLVDNQLAHRLIAEYLKNAPPSLVEDAVESLSGEALLHMIHTHEGVEAACMVLAYGSAKDRKKAIKAFKGHVQAAVMDEWGYLAVCTALSVTDDTALLRKNIVSDIQVCVMFAVFVASLMVLALFLAAIVTIPMMTKCRRADRATALTSVDIERAWPPVQIGRKGLVSEDSTHHHTTPRWLRATNHRIIYPTARRLPQSDIDDIIADKHGHKVLLQLLCPFSPRYFTPELLAIIKPRTIETSKRIEPENEGEEATILETQLGLSKKDDLLRRQELLKDGLWKSISTVLEESAADLLNKQFASDVVVEACIGGDDDVLEKTFGNADSVNAVHDAVIGAISSDDGMLESYFGSRAIRRVVLASNGSSGSGAKRFTERLYDEVIKGKAAKLKKTHAGKIIAALVVCGCRGAVVKAELKASGDRDGGLAWAKALVSKK